MEHRFCTLSKLDDAAVDSLARLHVSVLPSLLTDLGLDLVRRYYQVAKGVDSVIGYCAMTGANEVIGWVMGSPDPAALNARLRAPFVVFAAEVLRIAVTDQRAFWQLLRSVWASIGDKQLEGGIELTYLGVASSARGSGIGAALLRAFMDASRAAGYRSVELSVEVDNPAAISLYQAAGFTLKRLLTEGRFRRQRLQRAL